MGEKTLHVCRYCKCWRFEKTGKFLLKLKRPAKSPHLHRVFIWTLKKELFLCAQTGNTKGGSVTVPLTSCLTGLDYSDSQIKTKIVSCHTADSETAKQGDNGTVTLPPLVFPVWVQRNNSFFKVHINTQCRCGDFAERFNFNRNFPIFSNRQHLQ